jgi:hypothetical protein
MVEFIEKVLQQNVEIIKYKEDKQLPLFYYANYNIYKAQINQAIFLIAKTNNDIGLPHIRKQQKQLEQLTGMRCALYLEKMNYYKKDKLLEEGIPFIWSNKQVYLPFLGIMLEQNADRVLKPCKKLSFLSQKMIIMAIYEEWQDMNVTKVATKLKVTKTSVTRCFDELEVLGVPMLHIKAKTRLLSCLGSKKQTWEAVKKYMRTPLLAEFNFLEDFQEGLKLSGMSALSSYSMLGDNCYPTYGVMKKNLSELNLVERKQQYQDENPGCCVQELGYMIEYGDGTAIDPLTTYLLILESEREDPRVEQALEEMLEGHVW